MQQYDGIHNIALGLVSALVLTEQTIESVKHEVYGQPFEKCLEINGDHYCVIKPSHK